MSASAESIQGYWTNPDGSPCYQFRSDSFSLSIYVSGNIITSLSLREYEAGIDYICSHVESLSQFLSYPFEKILYSDDFSHVETFFPATEEDQTLVLTYMDMIAPMVPPEFQEIWSQAQTLAAHFPVLSPTIRGWLSFRQQAIIALFRENPARCAQILAYAYSKDLREDLDAIEGLKILCSTPLLKLNQDRIWPELSRLIPEMRQVEIASRLRAYGWSI